MSELTFIFKTAQVYRGDTPGFIVPEKTRNCHAIDETVSSLRRSMRLGEVANSRYWVSQLDMAGLGETAWNVMIQFTFTDVGLAMPIAPVCGMQLMRMWYAALGETTTTTTTALLPHESWKSSECRKHLLTMVTYVCSLPKNITVKNCNSVTILTNKGELDPDVDWTIKMGQNRKASAIIKPLKDGHVSAVQKAVTCFYRALCAEDEWNAVRTGDLLSEWGFTPLMWDILESACIEAPRQNVEFTQKFVWCAFYIRYYQSTWYWSTGKSNAYSVAVTSESDRDSELVWPSPPTSSDGYDENDTASSNPHGGTTSMYCNLIPAEWKARHDQNPGIVCSRPIWVQAVMLMVRGSNPAAYAGLMNQSQVSTECIPSDDVTMSYYSSDNAVRPVEDKALTMFTRRGREKNRGIDHHFNAMYSDLAMTNCVDIRDTYGDVAPRLYILEEQTHGPGLTNDLDIIARRVNSGMLQVGLDAQNPYKEQEKEQQQQQQQQHTVAFAGSDSTSGSFEASSSEKEHHADAIKETVSVFRSRRDWIKKKVDNEQAMRALEDGKRLVLIDTSELIGLAPTDEISAERKHVEEHFEKAAQEHSKVIGLSDAEQMLNDVVMLSRDIYVSRRDEWSAFYGMMKEEEKDPGGIILWGPMHASDASFNQMTRTIERAMIDAKNQKTADKYQPPWLIHPDGGVWTGSTTPKDRDSRYFIFHRCPFSIVQLEKGVEMFAEKIMELATKRKRMSRSKKNAMIKGGEEKEKENTTVVSILHGFYPPQDYCARMPEPVLRSPVDRSSTSKGKRKRTRTTKGGSHSGGDCDYDKPWAESRRALLFIMFVLLRWVQKQVPLVSMHRLIMVSPKGGGGGKNGPHGGLSRLWFSDVVGKDQDPIDVEHGMEETNVEERSRNMAEAGEHAWYLRQQINYITAQMTRAMVFWKEQWTAELVKWKKRLEQFSRFLEKSRKKTSSLSSIQDNYTYVRFVQRQIAMLCGEVVEGDDQRKGGVTTTTIDSHIVQTKIIPWIVHRGFMLREHRLPYYLPVDYFNTVEQVYYDNTENSWNM